MHRYNIITIEHLLLLVTSKHSFLRVREQIPLREYEEIVLHLQRYGCSYSLLFACIADHMIVFQSHRSHSFTSADYTLEIPPESPVRQQSKSTEVLQLLST